MNLSVISTRNLLRRKGKATFILAGLVIGVATTVGILTYVNAVSSDILHKLEQYGANILITPQTESLALGYGGLALGGVSFELEEIRQSDLARLEHIPYAGNIAAVGPVVLGVASVEDTRILMAGIDFSVSHILKPWWQVQGNMPAVGEVLLGADAARVLNLNTGDMLPVKGVLMPVSGVIANTGSQDDALAFVHLEDAQALFNKQGLVSMVEIAALCKDCPIVEMVGYIKEALPDANVMAIAQVVKTRMEMLGHFKRFAYWISAVILFIGGLVVLVTMMGSVRERTSEIGIFRAVGFRRRHIMKIVFLESGMLSLLAGLAGYGLGLAFAFAALVAEADGQSVQIPFSGEMAAGAVFLAIALGLAASIYPAFLAARMDPNDALRAL
jgi:putative ABC transport system permease protein